MDKEDVAWRWVRGRRMQSAYFKFYLEMALHSRVEAALFTATRTWEQPKCPLTDECIKKMGHIYTMEYYSAIKRNETGLFVVRRMVLVLETVIKSEVSQKEKNKYRMLTHIYRIKKKKGSEEPRFRTGIKMQT